MCACRYLHSYVSCLVEFYRPDSLRMSRNLACIYHQNVNSINNKYYIFIYKLYKKIYTCLYWNTLYVKVNKQTARIGFIVRVETIRIKCNKEERRLRTFLFFKIFKISLVRKYLVARRKFTKIKSPVLETLNTLRKALWKIKILAFRSGLRSMILFNLTKDSVGYRVTHGHELFTSNCLTKASTNENSPLTRDLHCVSDRKTPLPATF